MRLKKVSLAGRGSCMIQKILAKFALPFRERTGGVNAGRYWGP